jgi:HEAT repeat protein
MSDFVAFPRNVCGGGRSIRAAGLLLAGLLTILPGRATRGATVASDPAPAGGEGTTSPTLEELLATAGSAESDLGLRPDAFTQPYLLPWVRDLMTDPLSGPSRLQRWAEGALRAAPDAAALAGSLAGPADVLLPTEPAPARSADVPAQAAAGETEVPAWLDAAVGDFLTAASSAAAAMSAWRASVDDGARDEVEGLLRESYAWSDEPEGSAETPRETTVRRRLRAVSRLAGVPRDVPLREARRVLAALDHLKRRVSARSAALRDQATVRYRRPEGWVILGGAQDDYHRPAPEDVLVLDVGGNDVYKGSPAVGADGRVAVVLDLGGDDLYQGEGPFSLGAGRWGIGVLEDAAGDDVYRSGEHSQGSGFFGAGVLLDRAGDDVYAAGRASQGAGVWGYGILLDGGGNDAYRADRLAQGFAGVGGVGLLMDSLGNDQYFAGAEEADPREPGQFQSLSQGFSIGLRDYAAGGFGALLDGGGHDFYKCDYFGQGSAYWLGAGLLYDRLGRDTYSSRRYAQGAGVHFAAGALLDADGDDTYLTWGGSQAMGWDYGVGWLVDQRGNDAYSADWGSQGMEGAVGRAFFADNGGDDIYYYKPDHGQGHGSWDERRLAAGTALFADTAGRDRTFRADHAGTLWNEPRWGVGVDADSGAVRGLTLSEPLPPPPAEDADRQRAEQRRSLESRLAATARADPSVRVAEILDVAGHWGLDDSAPRAARRKLLALPAAELFPGLIEALDCRQTLGYLVQEELYLRAGPAGAERLEAHVRGLPADDASDVSSRTRRFAMYYLGQTASTRAAAVLLERAASPSWKDRSSAASALGRLYDSDLAGRAASVAEVLRAPRTAASERDLAARLASVPSLDRLRLVFALQPVPWKSFERLVPDSPDGRTDALDRAWAAFLLGRRREVLPGAEALAARRPPVEVTAALDALLSDPDRSVRQSAAGALGRARAHGSAAALAGALSDPDGAVRAAAAWSLGRLGPGAEDALRLQTSSTAPWTRTAAWEALCEAVPARTWEAVRAAAADADWTVRLRALDLLRRRRADLPAEGADAAALLESLAASDPQPWVRRRAELLKASGDFRAAPPPAAEAPR